MAPDYRSERMDTPEGKGIARRAWERYVQAAHVIEPVLGPPLVPVTKHTATKQSADLLGFWLMWHLEGGFEGLLRVGMSRSSIYRRIKRFRQITGQHPDEWTMAGVSFDLAAYHERKAGADS